MSSYELVQVKKVEKVKKKKKKSKRRLHFIQSHPQPDFQKVIKSENVQKGYKNKQKILLFSVNKHQLFHFFHFFYFEK